MEAEDQPLAELSSDDDNAFEDAFDDHGRAIYLT